MDKNLIIADEQYQSLINEIGSILLNARSKISREVNITMVDAYWKSDDISLNMNNKARNELNMALTCSTACPKT